MTRLGSFKLYCPKNHNSSARNYMIYQIGSAESYEQWADSVGDESYPFDEFLPYFKKSVSWTAPSESRTHNATTRYNESAYDPEDGSLHVTYPDYASPFSTWLDGYMAEVGIPLTDDFHSAPDSAYIFSGRANCICQHDGHRSCGEWKHNRTKGGYIIRRGISVTTDLDALWYRSCGPFERTQHICPF